MKKLNNKGFTLLEMMGVLILLVIILLVAVPNITRTIKKDRVNQLEKYEQTLCDAALTYISLEEESSTEISGSTLISYNYIADNLINPDTKKNASHDSVIITTKANGSKSCRLK